MTDPQPRPGVIARLSEPAQLPVALVDQVLDATDEERAAAAGELLDRTRAFLEQSGAIKPSMSVLQLRHNQVEVLAAIYGLVSRWWAALAGVTAPSATSSKSHRPMLPRR